MGIKSEIILSFCLFFFACLHAVLCDVATEDPFPREKCEREFPECECDEGYMGVAVLMCHNVSDFEQFSRKLKDGSVFKINTTLDLMFSGIRGFPREFLNGLVLERLYIDDIQTEEMEDGALEGIFLLHTFQVEISSIMEIPDFRSVSSSLRKLNLDNSRLTSISGDRLKNLPNLETVSFVNNTIQSIASDAFQGTENLIIFDVSYNQLKALPQNLFDPWKKLNKVVLTANNLLHVDQLFAVANPAMIYLDRNNLTDLDTIFHPHMNKTQTVLLSHNPISKITGSSFNGKTNNVHSLYLDNCLITEFNASHFKQLKSLSALDLSYNLIETVANQTIQFGVGLELAFTGNKIKEFHVNFEYRVAHINLAKNQLTSVPRSLAFSQVLEAFLSENRIEALGPEDFRGVHGIQTIELQDNLISRVDPLTFKEIRRDLQHLDLSRNKIRSLQGCVRDLYLLTSLNLTSNMIEDFEEGEFQGMVELLDLYLDNNLITSLGSEMKHFDQLRNLHIGNNRITTLNPEQIPKTLMYLYLEGNPFKCDCRLLPFLKYVNSSSIVTDKPLCIASNQTSFLPPARCPVGCQCFCSQDRDKHALSVDCSSAELTQLPPLFTAQYCSTAKENCSSLNIYLPRQTHFSQSGPFAIEDEIGGLNLSHNFLKSLEGARLPDGLRKLLLDHNDLQVPPLHQFHSMKNLNKVSLSGNPWLCDCDLLPFKNWILNKSEIVLDANETRCGPQSPDLSEHVIWSLTELKLCPVKIGSSASLVIGLLCFLLVLAVTTIVLIVYWTNVKIWLFAHGITCFQDYGALQSKELENSSLLRANRPENLQGNNFPLPNDPHELPRGRMEFNRNADSLFQEQRLDQPADGYVSITPESKLPV